MDAVLDFVTPFRPIFISLLLVLAVYWAASLVLSMPALLQSLDEGRVTLRGVLRGLWHLAMLVPFALAMMLSWHDRWVACERDLDMEAYLDGSLAAHEVPGKIGTYSCIMYRWNRGLDWSGEW